MDLDSLTIFILGGYSETLGLGLSDNFHWGGILKLSDLDSLTVFILGGILKLSDLDILTIFILGGYNEGPATPIPKPGENVEIGSFDETAIPVNKRMETDDLCYSVSEVKLYRLTNSKLEKYLGKMTNENTSTTCTKGDNTDIATDSDVKKSPPHMAYSRTGRPLRTAASKPTYVDFDENDSDANTAVPKVDNRTPHSKPSSSGPSASRIAAQNKRTVTPEFGLKPNKVYKHSNSPTYSISSSSASECHSEHHENDSDATFDGFEPLTEEDQEKLTKLGKLRTVEYGLKKRK